MKYGSVLVALGLLVLPDAAHATTDTDRVARGQYLFRAADCAACHLAQDGGILSGGRPFALPFGTIHATNITPDPETGIGTYDDKQWLRLMHKGVARDGKHVYPVMPYTSYTLLSDADALAIKAYLFTLPAVKAPRTANSLSFPFNQRWALVFWNWFNNPDRRMMPETSRTPQWNKGAYLTEALGHCAQCHTPRTITYGLSHRAYAGAVQMGWNAYNLTSDPVHGLGQWSDEALFSYLSTGQAKGHGPASGPMAEAVEHSLHYLPADDIRAMIVYLRSVTPRPDGPPHGPSAPLDLDRPALSEEGRRVFQQACAGCHLEDGTGRQSDWAALGGSHALSDPKATNLIAVLKSGTAIDTSHGLMTMQAFTAAYTPQELSALSTWMLHHFGNITAPVDPKVFRP